MPQGPAEEAFLQSVIHLPLKERQDLLSQLIEDPSKNGQQLGHSALKGRLFPLVPSRHFVDDAQCSQLGHTEQDIKEALETAICLQVRLSQFLSLYPLLLQPVAFQ